MTGDRAATAGPGGLAAAVYGASEGLTTAAIDAVAAGGQASTTSRIENYLGFPTGVSGAEFGDRALLQAIRFGTQMFVPCRAVGLTRPGGHYLVALDDGTQLAGKSVIVATGVSYRRLDAPDIEPFEGLGVFYSPPRPGSRRRAGRAGDHRRRRELRRPGSALTGLSSGA